MAYERRRLLILAMCQQQLLLKICCAGEPINVGYCLMMMDMFFGECVTKESGS